jgi:O-phospho-L-seryl-tRNASec:L-selenocysteinyl-tRNA synthase
VDAFVQSTDKNFLVPVGGAIVAAGKPELVDRVSSIYPGRASMSPLLDLFITLLSLGAKGWRDLLQQRKDRAKWFEERFAAVAERQGMRLLKCPANKISFVCDLTGLGVSDHLTFLGSALFTRRVSGPRVVLCSPPAEPPTCQEEALPSDGASKGDGEAAPVKLKGKYKKTIDGIAFESYGAHSNTYSCCYLTAACALGATQEELEAFLERFESALQDYRNGAGKKDKDAESKAK